jgi:hypothetical protein
MKAEHVKTPQNTDEVSSHPGKKGIGAKNGNETPPAPEKNRGEPAKKACKSGGVLISILSQKAAIFAWFPMPLTAAKGVRHDFQHGVDCLGV